MTQLVDDINTLKKAYVSYLNTLFSSYLSQVLPNTDISVAVHNEFSYNDTADVNITVKLLPGQIQLGIVQYPGEILVEVKEEYQAEVDEALRLMCIDRNEELATIYGGTYMELYSTPNVMGTFQDNGIYNKTAMSVSCALITFSEVMGIAKTLGVKIGSTWYSTKWVNAAITYVAETNASGAIGAGSVTEVGETASVMYVFTFIPRESNVLHQHLFYQIVHGVTPNKEYTLEFPDYDPSEPDSSEAVISCIVKTATISQEAKGFPVMQVTFCKRGE